PSSFTRSASRDPREHLRAESAFLPDPPHPPLACILRGASKRHGSHPYLRVLGGEDRNEDRPSSPRCGPVLRRPPFDRAPPRPLASQGQQQLEDLEHRRVRRRPRIHAPRLAIRPAARGSLMNAPSYHAAKDRLDEGTQIGAYEISLWIRDGGMASLYFAEDPTTEEFVAVK